MLEQISSRRALARPIRHAHDADLTGVRLVPLLLQLCLAVVLARHVLNVPGSSGISPTRAALVTRSQPPRIRPVTSHHPQAPHAPEEEI